MMVPPPMMVEAEKKKKKSRKNTPKFTGFRKLGAYRFLQKTHRVYKNTEFIKTLLSREGAGHSAAPNARNG